MAVAAMERHEHSEGQVARAISTSLSLQLMGKDHASLFIGQWAPTFLTLGLYNKLVTQLGHDRATSVA
jgi:hypothetical protein